MILDGASKAPQATILANGDLARSSIQLLLINPVKYYGFATEEHQPRLAHYNTERHSLPTLPTQILSSTSSIHMLT